MFEKEYMFYILGVSFTSKKGVYQRLGVTLYFFVDFVSLVTEIVVLVSLMW